MQALVQVLQQLVQLLAAQVSIRPSEGPAAYLPTEAKLTARFSDATLRRTMVSDYLSEIETRWNRADSFGLIDKLGRVRAQHTFIQNDPAATQPIAHLPQNDVTFFYEYLALDNANESGGRANRIGRDLVLGTTTVDAVTGTAAQAVRAIMHLRRLDDVLTRVLAAHAVTQATMTPIAEVLAMYRVEGDMNAPPSTESLTQGIPSGTQDATSIVNPAADLRHLALLAGPGTSMPGFIDFATATDAEIREAALLIWFVQIGGLDVVIQLPKSWRSNFAVWSSGNWTAAGYPSGSATAARQAAEQRWDDLVANMDVSRPSSGTSAAILVTPRNPAAMVAGILQEAVMMRRAWGTAQHLLGASPPPPAGPAVSAGMSYLYYHAGVENMQAILARALVAVMDTSGMRYSALRGKILSDVVIGSDIARMRPVTNMSDAAARPVLLQAWPKLAPWLQVNDHLTLLSDFVETVDGNTWRSWTQHRGNLSRYNRLLDYYQRVTAP